MGTPLKRAVSLALRHPRERGLVLAVLRPPEDPEFPEMWGLPALSLEAGETLEEGVARLGREKLGMALRSPRLLARGEEERPGYRLVMSLYEAEGEGTPVLPAPSLSEGRTLYIGWRWAEPSLLEGTARRGSLCCRLLLGGW